MGGCFLARCSLRFLFLVYKCWETHCRYCLHFDMKSIFSSSISKYLGLLGPNQCILRFFCRDLWLSSGANKWKNPVMLSSPVSVMILVDWVHSATGGSHPQLCQMKVHKVTQGRRENSGIFIFVFLLSFMELLQFGIKKSTCNCKLKGVYMFLTPCWDFCSVPCL